jgi:hypothetical protein
VTVRHTSSPSSHLASLAVLRRASVLGAGLVLSLVMAACTGSSKPPPPPPTVPASTTTTTTLPPGIQTTGPRTVLSPIGLNVRQGPSKSAKVLASAAQGVELAVIGYSSADGGWYKVKGETVSGWISDNPSLSAFGTFLPYQSVPLGFSVLYPSSWTSATTAAMSLFRSPTGHDTVAFRQAATAAGLGTGSADHVLVATQAVVACGVTTTMFTYALPSGGGPFVSLVRIPVAAKQFLGINSVVAAKADLATVDDFINSVTFSNPQCQGG